MLVDLVLLASAMALSPVVRTIFILLLASTHGPVGRGRRSSSAGWPRSPWLVRRRTWSRRNKSLPATGTRPSIGILAAKIALGLVLLAIAERQRRRIGRPQPAKAEPKWQARIDDMSPLFAVGLGAFFQPSVFVISAVATITGAKLSSVADYLSLVLFGLLSASTYLALDVYAVARPERSVAALARLKAWMDGHTDVIIAIVAAVVGLWLIGKSAYLLAT